VLSETSYLLHDRDTKYTQSFRATLRQARSNKLCCRA